MLLRHKNTLGLPGIKMIKYLFLFMSHIKVLTPLMRLSAYVCINLGIETIFDYGDFGASSKT